MEVSYNYHTETTRGTKMTYAEKLLEEVLKMLSDDARVIIEGEFDDRYQEGHDDGHSDGYEEGRSEGYEEGYGQAELDCDT